MTQRFDQRWLVMVVVRVVMMGRTGLIFVSLLQDGSRFDYTVTLSPPPPISSYSSGARLPAR
jgi:hypothetical protein